MPPVAVAGNGCVVQKEVFAGRSEAVTPIADPAGVEDVAAAIPLLWARLGRFEQRLGWFEQVAQRRHGAVVQVWRARPDAVERLVGVAGGLAEVGKAPGIAGVKRVLRSRKALCIGGPPVTVGADPIQILDLAQARE